MLGKLNKSYGLVALMLYLFFIPWVDEAFWVVYLLNAITFISYFFIINYFIAANSFDSKKLLLAVFVYSLISIIAYNTISYSLHGNFFVFSEADSIFYNAISKEMASRTIPNSIDYFLGYYGIDDLGMVLILSSLYRIIESNLFYNFFNLILGLVTTVAIFRIGKNLMSKKYAFLCAITFSLSSYYLWFHASGLKESFMVTLVVFSIDQWYKYVNKRRFKNLILGIIFALLLILFRPPITFFIVGSIGIGIVLDRAKGLKKILATLGIISFIMITYPFLEASLNRFLWGGDMQRLIEIKRAEDMVIGSLSFTYIVNIVSQLIGQFPTMLPSSSSNLSFYSPGLIFKILVSFPFLMGIYIIFKKKLSRLYPLVVFVLIEASSLIVILEGLEMRKSIPHFPIVFIIAFWFMDYFDNTYVKRRKEINGLYFLYIIFSLFLILFWNFR